MHPFNRKATWDFNINHEEFQILSQRNIELTCQKINLDLENSQHQERYRSVTYDKE